MTDQQREKILEAACGLCYYPCVYQQEDLDDFCERCPVEAAIDEALHPPLPPGSVICAYCKKPVNTKPENGLRYCVHCHWWINEDGSHIEETREFLKGEKTP